MFINYISEVISKKAWAKNTYNTKEYVSGRINFKEYKKNLKILKQHFAKLNNGKFKSTLIYDYDKIKVDVKKINDKDKEIIKFLQMLDYNVSEESYLLGFAEDENGKAKTIQSILDGFKNKNIEAMQKAYDKTRNEKIQKQIEALKYLQEAEVEYEGNFNPFETHGYTIAQEKKYKIVMSIQPRLIASQSTEVGWTSCMNLYEGINRGYVGPGIEQGVIVAYLARTGDEKNLDSPTARVLIKPMYNEKNEKEILYVVDKIYGTASEAFREKVNKIIESLNSKVAGTYRMSDRIYSDEIPSTKMIFTEKQQKMIDANDFSKIEEEDEQFIKYVIERLNKPEVVKYLKNASDDVVNLAIAWFNFHDNWKRLPEDIPQLGLQKGKKKDYVNILYAITHLPDYDDHAEHWIELFGGQEVVLKDEKLLNVLFVDKSPILRKIKGLPIEMVIENIGNIVPFIYQDPIGYGKKLNELIISNKSNFSRPLKIVGIISDITTLSGGKAVLESGFLKHLFKGIEKNLNLKDAIRMFMETDWRVTYLQESSMKAFEELKKLYDKYGK